MARQKRSVEAIASEMHAKGWRVDKDGVFHSPATPDGEAGGSGSPPAGHNQSGSPLKSLVARIERRIEEKASISADIREVYAEAKSSGYDPKILRKVIALRARDLNERLKEETMIDMYLQEVGMKS
jgi:uncharacterized protein (UPF0335 family)